MSLHEFGEDLVLGLELPLEGLDALRVGVGLRAFGLEDGCAVLEELLLPSVEEVGMDAGFLADLGDGLMVEKMALENGHLLLGRMASAALSGHGLPSDAFIPRTDTPVPAKAGQEWCADWYDGEAYSRYAKGDLTPPASGSSRVLRGGSWGDVAFYCRTACRDLSDPGERYAYAGFRVARAL